MHTILRTFNSTKVLELIRLLSTAGLTTHFTVVINSKEDRIGTKRLLRDVDSAIPISLVTLDEYGWSRALNAGLRSLPPVSRDDELVMMVSNDVKAMPQEIKLLKEAALVEDASCGYALFEGRTEATYELPRNTFVVWRRRLFEEIGLFDESLDRDTGMEDYDMVLRAFKHCKRLPFLGPKNVRLEQRTDVNLADKLAWETRGVQMIEERYSKDVVEKVRNHIRHQNEQCHTDV
jgi:hypothetical protein